MRPRTTQDVVSRAAHKRLLLGSLLLGSLLVGGCAADRDGDPTAVPAPSPPSPASTSTAAPGFAPASPPPPAGTFTPSPGSWDGTVPAPGYRVVLLTTDQDARTRVLAAAVRSWADEVEAELTVVVADRSDEYVDRIQESVDAEPDLVVATGEALVDPLALVTASNLDRQFLLVGAELAEPTLNVTAADWTGASYRGEGLGRPSTYDPASFTPERSARAVRAGVAAVLTGLNGHVVWVA